MRLSVALIISLCLLSCKKDAPAGQEQAAKSCKEKPACKANGLCADKDGNCVAGSDDDCKQSDSCAQYGRCKRYEYGKDKSKAKCEVGSDEDCKKTVDCKSLGKCTYVNDGLCMIKSDDDCKQSEACTKEGRCRHAAGGCLK